MRGFTVRNAMTGKQIGQVTYDGQNWHFSSPSLSSMVQARLHDGLTPDQVLAYYDGWGNQAVNTVAL